MEVLQLILLETRRLLIRELRMDDIDRVMIVWGDPEVMQHCGGAGSRDQEMKHLQSYIKHQEERGFSAYLVLEKKTGQFIGVCGFNPPNHGYDAELMYHIAKEHGGQGYASEAMEACVDYAINDLKLTKLGASITPDNVPSQRVVEKLGFRYIGKKWCNITEQYDDYFELVASSDQV